MNTRKYDTETRKSLKRDQRTPAYLSAQRSAADHRAQLERALTDRNELIGKLRKALADIKTSGHSFSTFDYAALGVV